MRPSRRSKDQRRSGVPRNRRSRLAVGQTLTVVLLAAVFAGCSDTPDGEASANASDETRIAAGASTADRACDAVQVADVEAILGVPLQAEATATVVTTPPGNAAVYGEVSCAYHPDEGEDPSLSIRLSTTDTAGHQYLDDVRQSGERYGESALTELEVPGGAGVEFATDTSSDGSDSSLVIDHTLVGDTYWRVASSSESDTTEGVRDMVSRVRELVLASDVSVSAAELLADKEGPCAGLPTNLLVETAGGPSVTLTSLWMSDTVSLVRCIAKGDIGEVWVSRKVRPGGIDLRDAGDVAMTEEAVYGVDGDTAMVGTQLHVRALAQFAVDGQPWRTEIVTTDGSEPTYEQILAFTEDLAAGLQ